MPSWIPKPERANQRKGFGLCGFFGFFFINRQHATKRKEKKGASARSRSSPTESPRRFQPVWSNKRKSTSSRCTKQATQAQEKIFRKHCVTEGPVISCGKGLTTKGRESTARYVHFATRTILFLDSSHFKHFTPKIDFWGLSTNYVQSQIPHNFVEIVSLLNPMLCFDTKVWKCKFPLWRPKWPIA